MYYFMRYWVQLFFHLKYRMKIWNKENAPKLKGGYIIACNHQKYADPPMIASVIHAKFSFMAKDELFHKNKFFKWLIIKCGAFPVVRGAGDGEAVRIRAECWSFSPRERALTTALFSAENQALRLSQQ